MRTELPICTRCCFCLPLRYGLITWGYLRLAISMFFFVALSVAFFGALEMPLVIDGHYDYLIHVVILGFLVLLTLTDVVLNTIFIVGGHKKNPKLLKTYFIYSSVLFILTAMMGMMSVIHTMIMIGLSGFGEMFFIWIAVMDVTAFLAQVLAQIYVLLLVRSEIIKLENNCEFRFVNIAAEAECTMNGEKTGHGKEERDNEEC